MSVPDPDLLSIALRAWTDPAPGRCRSCWRPIGDPALTVCERCAKRGSPSKLESPRYALVIDFETTTDRVQRMTFGCARFYKITQRGLKCTGEWLIYDDELPSRDPEGFETLREYARRNLPALAEPLEPFPMLDLRLIPRSQFVNGQRGEDLGRGPFYRALCERKAVIVGFNLPFDLSRLAAGWERAEYDMFAGGWSLILWAYKAYRCKKCKRLFTERTARKHRQKFGHDPIAKHAVGELRENRWRPRVSIRTLSAKQAMIGLTKPAETDGPGFRGHFLDLKMAAFGLTDRAHSLESACKAFDVSYRDVLGNAGCRRRNIPHGMWDKPYTKQETEHGRITPEYIDYCRDDVAATAKLYEAISREHRRHPIDLQITKLYSPASLTKAYLQTIGVTPRLVLQPDFRRDVLGYAMTAYSGGRTECRARRIPVPVVYVDFASMYPTVCALLDTWRHVTAQRIDCQEATEDIRRLVEQTTLEDMLKPSTWRAIGVTLAQVKPDGDVFPVRACYDHGRTPNIGSNQVTSDEPLWFALPDVIASKLITGKAPEIIRAIRLTPVGRQPGLRSVKLLGKVEIDPRQDMFKVAVEQRRKLGKDKNGRLGRFLKTLSNGFYGIAAEMNRKDGVRTDEILVYGLDNQPFTPAREVTPEQPGEWCFPPLAATITAAARLMLATLEATVTKAGGTWAFGDTDSMAIIATKNAENIDYIDHTSQQRTIRALSWDQVNEIVSRFEALNPYSFAGSVLEIEDENYELDPADPKQQRVLRDKPRQLWCYAISSKRYALYNRDRTGAPQLRSIVSDPDDSDNQSDSNPDAPGGLRKFSEHGLGHLRNPANPESDSREWIKQTWEWIIRQAHQLGAPEPDWLDEIAVTRWTITTPHYLAPFRAMNRKRPAAERIRPHNFLLVAHTDHPPPGHVGTPFLLVAPFEPDRRKWRKLEWTNAHDGTLWRPITDQQATNRSDVDAPVIFPGEVIVKTYRDVLDLYRTHPEPKSLASDGEACTRATVGQLHRRHIKPLRVVYIGKESNRLEERESGLADGSDTLNHYIHPSHDPFAQLTAPTLRKLADELKLTATQIAASAGVSQRSVERALAGKLTGTTKRARDTRAKLTAYTIARVRAHLRDVGAPRPPDHEALLATFLNQHPRPDREPSLCACGCGEPIRAGTRGRPRRYIDDAHRKRHERTRGSRLADEPGVG